MIFNKNVIQWNKYFNGIKWGKKDVTAVDEMSIVKKI